MWRGRRHPEERRNNIIFSGCFCAFLERFSSGACQDDEAEEADAADLQAASEEQRKDTLGPALLLGVCQRGALAKEALRTQGSRHYGTHGFEGQELRYANILVSTSQVRWIPLLRLYRELEWQEIASGGRRSGREPGRARRDLSSRC